MYVLVYDGVLLVLSYITPSKCSLATILFPAMRIDGGAGPTQENVRKGTFMKGDRSIEIASERSYDS